MGISMHKKIFGYLLLFYSLFTIYNTLIPFQFDLPLGDFWHQLSKVNPIPYFQEDGDRASMTDIVGNILLFVPFGFFCYMFLYHINRSKRLLISTLSGALLSTLIEFAQLFISSRNTALHDLINNTLGSFIGAGFAGIYAQQISAQFYQIVTDLVKRKPALLYLVCILIAQCFTAIMPFTVSISVSSLAESVKETNLIPFTYKPISVVFFNEYSKQAQFQLTDSVIANLGKANLPPEIIEGLKNAKFREPAPKRRFIGYLKSGLTNKEITQYRDIILHYALMRSQEANFDFTQFFENLLYWIAVGFLILLCFELYFSRYQHFKIWLWLATPLYFFMLETAQLFITSRVSDVNDIISGTAGVYLGYILYRFFTPENVESGDFRSDMLKIPLLVYTIFIFYSGFRPFDWSLNPHVWQVDLRLRNIVPFYAYFKKTTMWNIYDLIRTLCFFMPISLYLSYHYRKGKLAYHKLFVTMPLLGFLAGGIIEFTQLLSPTRVAEITDILSFGISGWIGVFLLYYYEKEVMPTLFTKSRQ
jgi:glycopeptide antibiotics resistance protein